MNYYEVAPVSRKLVLHDIATYKHAEELPVGTLTKVNYRRSVVPAIVLAQTKPPSFKTKIIQEVVTKSAIPKDIIDVAQWLGKYYGLSLPQAFKIILPQGIAVKRKKTQRENEVQHNVEQARSNDLNSEQKRIINDITTSTLTTHLLHGVTGAGKTHIYIDLLRRTLARGNDAMFLVPEIALTTHLLERIQPYFPNVKIAVIHSQQSERERHLLWQSIKENPEPVLVMGPRSAIFSPIHKLGVVIIDEAHDSSFKQQQVPYYDALHVAAYRARSHGGILVLGTATPDITSYHLTRHEKIQLHSLQRRFHAQKHHRIELIDKRKQENFGNDSSYLSLPLIRAVETAAANKQQSLLFLNRRGFATSIICDHCGWLMECRRCQLPLTYHKANHKAFCHLCGAQQQPALTCPECSHAEIRFRGAGTQRIEDELTRTFSQHTALRFDQDTKNSHNTTLEDADIIVGTQMVSKGFDLPRLSVVGVLNADAPLFLPDYRAGELVYQQLTQIVGRNDRRGFGGTTFIQTSQPEHYAVQAALHNDYDEFYQQELAHRKRGHYPPFTYLLKLTAQRKTAKGAQKLLVNIASELQDTHGLQALGPTPSFYENAYGHKTWHLLLKSSSRTQLVSVAKKYRTSDVICELDPQNLL